MIFDIQRFSTHDGPGIRTVVFFKGCPLSCAWCENPESQSFRPELLYTRSRCVSCGGCVSAAGGEGLRADPAGGILIDRSVEPRPELGAVCPALALRIAGRELGVEAIMAEVLKDASFFAKSGGGLTISGGEPLAQADFAIELLEAALAKGVDIAIETCLAVPRASVERAAALPLHWLADLKHTDAAAFRAGTTRRACRGTTRRACRGTIRGTAREAGGAEAAGAAAGAAGGVDVGVPLGNLEYLAARGADLTLRVPVIPGFNDDETSMRGILEFAAGLPRAAGAKPRRLDLLPYHDLAAGKYAGLGRAYAFPPGLRVESARIAHFAELGAALGLDITIGG